MELTSQPESNQSHSAQPDEPCRLSKIADGGDGFTSTITVSTSEPGTLSVSLCERQRDGERTKQMGEGCGSTRCYSFEVSGRGRQTGCSSSDSVSQCGMRISLQHTRTHSIPSNAP